MDRTKNRRVLGLRNLLNDMRLSCHEDLPYRLSLKILLKWSWWNTTRAYRRFLQMYSATNLKVSSSVWHRILTSNYRVQNFSMRRSNVSARSHWIRCKIHLLPNDASWRRVVLSLNSAKQMSAKWCPVLSSPSLFKRYKKMKVKWNVMIIVVLTWYEETGAFSSALRFSSNIPLSRLILSFLKIFALMESTCWLSWRLCNATVTLIWNLIFWYFCVPHNLVRRYILWIE